MVELPEHVEADVAIKINVGVVDLRFWKSSK